MYRDIFFQHCIYVTIYFLYRDKVMLDFHMTQAPVIDRWPADPYRDSKVTEHLAF